MANITDPAYASVHITPQIGRSCRQELVQRLKSVQAALPGLLRSISFAIVWQKLAMRSGNRESAETQPDKFVPECFPEHNPTFRKSLLRRHQWILKVKVWLTSRQ
jgi:hypothetical protein